MSGTSSSTLDPFLVVAYSLPGRASATPIIVNRLLENFDPGEVVLIGRPSDGRVETTVRHRALPIPAVPSSWRGQRYWRMMSVLPGVVVGLRAIRRYHARVIVGIYPDESSLLTAYLLHRLTDLPWMPYFFDLYQENQTSRWQVRLARWLQPRVFQSASRVLALTEGIAALYQERHQLDVSLIPHCMNQPVVPPSYRAGELKEPVVIGCAGNINAHRVDAIRSLVEAIRGSSRYELHYFTSQPQSYLVENDLWCENARQMFAPSELEFFKRLQQCDILYLPMTFDDAQRQQFADQLLTSFPTRSIEYLLSGRPILVHCPEEYYTARFFRRHKCGLVVAEPGADAISGGLEMLLGDQELCASLAHNALQAAAQFDGRHVTAILRDVIEEVRTASPTPASLHER